MRTVRDRLRRSVTSRSGLLLLGLALALTAPRSVGAAPNVWTSHGPEGGWAKCFAVDPSNPSTIWAGFWWGGIWKSLDRGATWQPAHGGNATVGGAVVYTIVIDPADSNTVWAAFDGTGLWQTVDGGQSWTNMPRLSLSVTSVSALVRHPTIPTTMWAGTEGGIYKTTNGGTSWTGASYPTGIISALVMHPSNPDTLYAADNAGVYKTTNGGTFWAPANTGLPAAEILHLVIDPVTPATLYLTTPSAVFRTTNGASTWSHIRSQPEAFALAIDPMVPSTIYLTTEAFGLYRSLNSGTSWSFFQTGIPPFRHIGPIAVDPTDSLRVWTGVERGFGVYMSTNGTSWAPSNAGLTAQYTAAVVSLGDATRTLCSLAPDRGIFRSVDGGESWTISDNGGLTVMPVNSLAASASSPNVVYAGVSPGMPPADSNHRGVYRSTDSCATWVKVHDNSVAVMAVHPTNPNIVYASGRRSIDGGATWANINTTGVTGTLRRMALAPSDPNTIYMATSTGMFRTTNDAATWTAVGTTPANLNVLAVHPTIPTTLYAGTFTGALRSLDSGATWTAINSGLSGIGGLGVNVIVIDPTTPSTIYAASNVVYKSTNGGTTWQPRTNGLHHRHVVGLTIDTTDPSIVYAATGGGGVFVLDQENVCGNGVVEPDEACDDGNAMSGDCCSATCTIEAAGTACRNAAGPCDLAEQCTGSSPVCPADVRSTAVCRPSAGPCDVAEQCTGSNNNCPLDTFVESGTECRASAGTCDIAEQCNGMSAACPADAKSTAECRGAAGTCDVAEQCDGVGNHCPADALAAGGTECRGSAGACDLIEQCSGTSVDCPADAKSTDTCRASAGACDVAEQCDGAGDHCPADALVSAGSECRAAAGACDLAEQCTGAAAACPADAKSTQVCRGAAGTCDVAESCNGASDHCPADGFLGAGASCRPAAGACDLAEQCSGASAACPADAKSTAVCRPAAGPCDMADSCNGMTDTCPADAFVAAGTVCRASSGTCDVAEACTGSAAACPPNGGLPDTDGDALCDAIDPCTNVGGGRTMSGVNPIPKIVLNKINTDAVPNNDHLTLTGAFILPASADFSDLHPQAFGARVVLRNRFGVAELDVTLPGGLFNGANTRGWKLTNQGKTWTYTDSTSNPIGDIVTVNLYDRNTQIPNRVEIRVVGDDGTYPVMSGDEPIDGILAIGGPAQAAAGLCGETAFLPADCFYNLSGNQLTCRP